jgi:hypothetical protein
MPHTVGKIGPAFQTGAAFVPIPVPAGIDARGGFFLTARRRSDPEAKNDVLDLSDFEYKSELEFDYVDLESGGETRAGYYYGVSNLKRRS